MAKIFKYPLHETSQPFELPKGATPLCVQVQRGVPTVWASVLTPGEIARLEGDHQAVGGYVRFDRTRCVVAVTGGDVPEGTYLGTFVLDAEGFVGHVYVQTHGYW